METTDRLQQFNNLKKYQKYYCIDTFTGQKSRFVNESDNTAFVYAKGCKRRGYRMSVTDFLNRFEMIIPSEQEQNEKWHKSIMKIINALEKSGLWPDLKEKYANLYYMTLSDKEKINSLYWGQYHMYPDEYNKNMNMWISKYPFLYLNSGKNSHDYVVIDTFYIWKMSDCKTKSMYFGKAQNAQIKEEIKNALANKQNCRFSERANYDVTFEYDAQKKEAWYSEEYKDCVNGHYYLALDEKIALFCEND